MSNKTVITPERKRHDWYEFLNDLIEEGVLTLEDLQEDIKNQQERIPF